MNSTPLRCAIYLRVSTDEQTESGLGLASQEDRCRALALASNRSFEEWPGVFGNDLLASAAVDRLTHHAHTLVLRGESYRQTSRRKEMTSLISGAPVVTASAE